MDYECELTETNQKLWMNLYDLLQHTMTNSTLLELKEPIDYSDSDSGIDFDEEDLIVVLISINNLEIHNTGCGQCGMKYYDFFITGQLTDEFFQIRNYYAHISPREMIDCYCESNFYTDNLAYGLDFKPFTNCWWDVTDGQRNIKTNIVPIKN